ncbi:DUF2834 domain-containing protein [Metabacillus sp. FJAT-52054]|uniref:DUF2834 domain-containing protein n=1 Tax=Metabacillus sediminis TaxID=3117746 RepID=A0ABZ2NIW3_9BACI
MLQDKTETQISSYDSPISKKLIIAVLVLFTPLTVMAVVQNGFLGIFAKAFQNYATIQIFVDLLIASFLILIWMWFDAKKTNRSFWPWALLTLAAGSFGPLLYLLFGKGKRSKTPK